MCTCNEVGAVVPVAEGAMLDHRQTQGTMMPAAENRQSIEDLVAALIERGRAEEQIIQAMVKAHAAKNDGEFLRQALKLIGVEHP
jgi:hypothetical protein